VRPHPSGSLLLVLSGPSGAGKTSLAQRLLRGNEGLARAVTATTRAARGAERDGVDYHFLTEAAFRRRLAAGDFLEHAEVYGRLYGTPRASVEAVLASGRHCLLVVDVQGVRSLRRVLAGAGFPVRYVFVRTPDLVELERRLRERGEDDEATIQARLAEARDEEAEAATFDEVLVNDDLETATKRLREAVQGWTRPSRQAD
jgi:guanylate kinase